MAKSLSSRWLPICAAALVVPLLVAPIQAQPDDAVGKQAPPTLAESLTQADATVVGTVKSVDYRLSSDDERIPHTFVTYAVRETLAGRVRGDSITLRFVGGSDGHGRFLSVTGVPMFSPGDEDILLIRGNGRDDCPLVDCGEGRLRIHQDRVYSNDALPLVAIEDGRLQFGWVPEPALLQIEFPAPDFDALMKNPEAAERIRSLAENSSLEELRQRYEREAPRTLTYSVQPQADKTQGDGLVMEDGQRATLVQAESDRRPAIALEQLRSTLTEAIGRMSTSTQGRVVTSLDPDQSFRANPLRATRPASAREQLRQTRPSPRDAEESEQDRREREEIEAQDFNPVLRKQDQ